MFEKNKSLYNYNTFKINVKTKLFTELTDKNNAIELLKECKSYNLPILFLGGGSNILLTKDFNGIVIHIKNKGINQYDENENEIYFEIEAGEIWENFVKYSVERNLGNIENLAGIPGYCGAAPIQNIGAYGTEIKESLTFVEGIFTDTLQFKRFSNHECEFNYRTSIFKTKLKNLFLITSIGIKLNKKPNINVEYKDIKEEIKNKNLNINDLKINDIYQIILEIRKRKLPDYKILGNCGSFFKNPEVDLTTLQEIIKDYPDIPFYVTENSTYKIPAAWLIEKVGLKGYKSGNVGTYERQPLVIVNYGNANPEEIIRLSKKITDNVYEKFKILLEPEVNII